MGEPKAGNFWHWELPKGPAGVIFVRNFLEAVTGGKGIGGSSP